MQVYIYIHPTKNRVWAVNELGTMVVYGGSDRKMRQQAVNYPDWSLVASNKRADGYEFAHNLTLGSDGEYVTPKQMLEAVSAFRELYYRGGNSLGLDLINQSTVREVCEVFCDLPILKTAKHTPAVIRAARKWLESHAAPIIPMPAITLTGGQGRYF